MRALLFALLAAALQQAAPTETGSIAGTVVRYGATRAPIPGAQVKVTAVRDARGDTYTAETTADGAGRFSFTGVPVGRYQIEVQAADFGFRPSPNRFIPSRTITIGVARGERVELAALDLLPASTIRGRVLDGEGRPMAGMLVEVLRRTVDEQGRMAWAVMPGPVDPMTRSGPMLMRTDPQGSYQHSLLGPGDYHVRTILESQGTLPLAVYYPETTESSRATPLVVGEDAAVTADIRIGSDLLRGIYTISGKVVHPMLDTAASSPSLTLMQRDAGVMDDRSLRFRASANSLAENADGKFVFTGIRPGSYDLFASAILDGKEHTAKVPVEIRDRNAEDVALVLKPALSIEGKLVIAGTPRDMEFERNYPRPGTPPRDPQRSRAGDIRIALNRKDGLFFGVNPEASIAPSGTAFAFYEVPPGPYEISAAIVADGRPPSPDLYIADIRAGGRSVFDDGFEAGVDPVDAIEIVADTRGGSIEGRIQGRSNIVAALILVPEPTRRSNASLYRLTYRPQNGTFHLTGLAPGRYKIFAVPYLNETVPYRSAEFLARYEARALSVVVESGAIIGGVQAPFLDR